MKISIAELDNLYYEEKKSTRQIAKILGVSNATVIKYLKNYSTGTRTLQEGWKYRATDEYREKIRVTQLGQKNSIAKLTEEKVINIRKEYAEMLSLGMQKTKSQYILADKYNVKRSTISDIVLKKTWNHI